MERSIHLPKNSITETDDGYVHDIGEDTIKEVEGLLLDFRKNHHADYSALKFLINGEEYFIYRCIRKPNTHISCISNREQFVWWDTEGMWESFGRPRGDFHFSFPEIKNAEKRNQTAIRFCKDFLLRKLLRTERKEVA